MGDYVHTPIVVYGRFHEVEQARLLLEEIISRRRSKIEADPSDFIRLERHPEIPKTIALANGYAQLLIPSSGGKLGGSIKVAWDSIIEEWKDYFREFDINAYWCELRVGEVPEDELWQTSLDYAEEWRESQDP